MGGDIPGGRGPLGAQLEVGRQVDNVTARVAAARQQIDALPDPIRAALIPALQDATNTAAALARNGFGATANQIRIAAAEAERLEQRVSRTRRGMEFGLQFGGQGRRGVEFGLQEVSLRGYTAQLQVLQRALSGAASEARGPAAGAFNQLRSAIGQAASRGTLDVRATREEIERLTQEAVRAAAVAAGISPGRLARAVGRAGDIGRGAFGNVGLAVQQAVFAFDDFMSVTGGLDQRIRAAGNNLSQLGFIVGGTAGLIAGVLTSAIAQAVVGYIRWQNAGVGTEDSLRALNNALESQRTLVDELAQSFASLADEISRLGMSKQGADALQLSKQLDDIKKKQKDFNRGRIEELDPEVQRQRGIAEARERELKEAANPGDRVRLQSEIIAARRAAKEAADRAAAAPQMTAAQAGGVAIEARRAVELQAAAEGEDGNAARAANANANAAQAGFNGRLGRAKSEAERIAIAQDQLLLEKGRLQQEIRANNFFGAGALAGGDNTVRQQQLVEVERALRQLEQGMVNAANEIEIKTVEAAILAARRIGQAQESVAMAIESGVPGAVGLQVELDRMDEALSAAVDEMDRAQKMARESGTGADYEAARKAEESVRGIQESINARDEEVAAIEATSVALAVFTAAMDKIRSDVESGVSSARADVDRAATAKRARSTPRNAEERDIAEASFRERQASMDAVNAEIAQAQERRRNDPAATETQARIAEIDSMLKSTGVLGVGQREQLITERSQLQAKADEFNRDGGVDERKREFDDIVARQEAEQRGRKARMRKSEVAGIELGNTLADMSDSFTAEQRLGLAPDRDKFEQDRRRVIDEAMRSTAPAIFDLADQVENAIVQGPSRAALQATDVSTSQGAAELNRLLRGDDSAKDQNLAELQKQSKSLDDLVVIAKENAGVGVW